jgi:hypothetical protein
MAKIPLKERFDPASKPQRRRFQTNFRSLLGLYDLNRSPSCRPNAIAIAKLARGLRRHQTAISTVSLF